MTAENYKRVLNFALTLTRDLQAAKDITQDTFIKSIRFADKFEVGTNYEAWLMTICKNTFINEYRKQKTHPVFPFSALERNDTWFTDSIKSEESIYEEPFSDEILTALSQVSEEQREILFLHYVDGIGYFDIAAMLNMPFGTVMSKVGRAYNIIRKQLNGKYTVKSTKGFAAHSKAGQPIDYPSPDEMKQCTRCNLLKQYKHFYFNKKFWDGYHPYCKECMKIYNTKNQKRHVDLLTTNVPQA